MNPAPVALFAYRRPDHLRRTVDALRGNRLAGATMLHVFSDAARTPADEAKVAEVRSYLQTVTGFAGIIVTEAYRNLGLAGSIIAGVTAMVERYGRVIVLEDDLVTSPHFLDYMNEALERYRDEERVISIHGYLYPVRCALPETFFLKGADCWGWATWKRGWDLFEPDGAKLLAALRERGLLRKFDFNGTYPYSKMLKNQIEGKTDSWAIRWNASAFLRDRLTLYPGTSLVSNIGTDCSGTNCPSIDHYDTDTASRPVPVRAIPIEENETARRAFEDYFRSIRRSFGQRLFHFLRKW